MSRNQKIGVVVVAILTYAWWKYLRVQGNDPIDKLLIEARENLDAINEQRGLNAVL